MHPAQSFPVPQAAFHPQYPQAHRAWAPAPQRTSPVVWVLAAMALMALLGGVFATCGVVVGLAALGASTEGPSGVVLGAQIPQETVDALRERRLLPANEGLLAFHDATLRLDMAELSFVTPERVVYARGDTVAALPLVDVTRVTHHNELLVGDVLDIAAEDGRSLRIEIAPLNGGDAFASVLENAWRKHHPEARIDHAKR